MVNMRFMLRFQSIRVCAPLQVRSRTQRPNGPRITCVAKRNRLDAHISCLLVEEFPAAQAEHQLAYNAQQFGLSSCGL